MKEGQVSTKVAVLGEDEIRARLGSELSGWSLVDGQIERSYRTDGWPITLMLVNMIGYVAEAADHHPDGASEQGERCLTRNN
jgi:4a-hydroxytetrahydrobiopterin dehydratase